MSVVIETTLGDITIDLFLSERPRACLNFLKLCKVKYYNYSLFHTISRGFIAQTGDPTGSRNGGESIFGIIQGPLKRYFEGENEPRIKHTKMGLISFVGNDERMIGSQFFITLGEDLIYLDEKHCVFGEVVEGVDVLEMINEVICDTDDRPYQDVRITHTVILDDPYADPQRLVAPSRSPSPNAERLQGSRIAPDEEIDELEGKTVSEITEMQAEREAKARATILEMVGDLPDADMAPPENVLFVCKLNPVTNDDDLEIIFSRFGKIKSCEVIRDKKTGDSLQYAFVEFEDQKACENAYFKMDNVLIDDRRIHVDFSQSVSKVKWHGKGRGVTHFDEKGRKSNNDNKDIGKGNYNYDSINSRKNKNKKIFDTDRNYSRKDTKHSLYSNRNEEFTREKGRYKTSERETSLLKKSRSKSRSQENKDKSSKSSRDKSESSSRDASKHASREKYISRKKYGENSSVPRKTGEYSEGKDVFKNKYKAIDKSNISPRPSEKLETIFHKKGHKSLKSYKKSNKSGSEEYKGKILKKKIKYSSEDSDYRSTKKSKKHKNYSTSTDSENRKKSKLKKSSRKHNSSSSDTDGNDRKRKKT